MMVESILESSQDFGMSNGALPQWKRELLQRRAAQQRSRAPAAAPPPPPPPPPDEDEELRYGPGIVNRLKSRYLSLALRDAPRRRPSVLRRATSLEHLLDERPPPAPRVARAPRPASLAAPPPPPAPLARRDSVKRARSVDALSRLDSREELAPPSPSPPSTRPAGARAGRPPRRPTPLLREAERPPPDVVRSTLRKFESAPARRVTPAPRVVAPRCSLTPERPESAPSPPPDAPASPAPAPPSPAPESPAPPSPVLLSPAPLSPVRLSPAPRSPTLRSPTPQSPVPRPPVSLSPRPEDDRSSVENDTSASGNTEAAAVDVVEKVVSRAALEGIGRAGCTVRYSFTGAGGPQLPPAATNTVLVARRVGVIRPMPAAGRAPAASPPPAVNGHSTPVSRIGAAGVERAWSGGSSAPAAWARAARPRAAPATATSVVFNFSDRKEVPDYIENDGIVLRSSRRTKLKDDSGAVVLRASGSDDEEEADGRPPSPCAVRFVNDNVLINGRSSLAPRTDRARLAQLKLQFDDSLTRTHEYPSETSLCEDSSPPAALAHNTLIGMAALSSYTPHKTAAGAFQLGVTRRAPPAPAPPAAPDDEARACAADLPRSWSETRALATDLLF